VLAFDGYGVEDGVMVRLVAGVLGVEKMEAEPLVSDVGGESRDVVVVEKFFFMVENMMSRVDAGALRVIVRGRKKV
tara:strand:+ start:7586 stop:7813 length:228 start_codon:yes stop_codon:yes gene_type:complete